MKKTNLKKIEEKILSITIEIAKQGKGALFIIGNKIKYEKLMKQKIQKFNIFDSGSDKLIKSLAIIDGAIIIDNKGNVLEYGALIKNTKPLFGYGTRHAAALTASKNNNISILCSEEEKKVKIFRDGKYIMQIDPMQKNVEKSIPEISRILESLGAGLLGTIGTTLLVPTLGITLIPGVIIFGSSYYAINYIMKKFRKEK